MSGQSVIVIGAGGHAKVVIELLRAQGCRVVGCTGLDPSPSSVLGAPVVGDDSVLPRLFAEGVRQAFSAIGDNAARLAAGQSALDLGFELITAVSPACAISPSARLGRGVAVMAGAVINADAHVGDFAIVNSGAVIDHDARIGVGCHVGPGAVLAGAVSLGAGVLIGAGASVVPGRTIGARTLVGAGAAVVGDLPDDVVAVGVPARIVRRAGGPSH